MFHRWFAYGQQVLWFLLYDLMIRYTVCYPYIWSVSASCSSWGLIMFFLPFPHVLTYILLVVIGIYSCGYYFVSLHFTNWLHLSLLLKSLPKLQPEPSLKVVTRSWITIPQYSLLTFNDLSQSLQKNTLIYSQITTDKTMIQNLFLEIN